MESRRTAYIFGVLGKKGSGKTTLCRELAERACTENDKILWISPVERPRECDFVLWGAKASVETIRRASPGSILYCPDIRSHVVSAVLAAVMLSRNWIVVIDEIDKIKGNKELKDLCHYIRHVNCVLVFNSRRYADVPRLLTSQADYLYLGKTHEKIDVDYVKSVCGTEVAKGLRKLGKHQFLKVDMATWGQKIIEPNPKGARVL